MRKLLFIPLIFLIFLLQGCSWIVGFYIANTTNETIMVDIKLAVKPGSFPIFHYPGSYFSQFTRYELKKNGSLNFGNRTAVHPDTIETYSHFIVPVAPNTAVEIGQLQNDTYRKYDQHFINGRCFNLEKLTISGKKVEIEPATFDNYFRKGKNGGVYFVL